jgi:type VI secretion system secreted protein VgrG
VHDDFTPKMTVGYSQDQRILSLDTPLGKDVLILTAVAGEEEISRLFRYRLDMISEEPDIKPADIVGKHVTFSTRLSDGSWRYYDGYVSHFYAGGGGQRGLRQYRAEVVPWLWFLTRTADCRIFQTQTVPQIIEQVFSDHGFPDFETSEIRGKHPSLDYCVQYRETDFNFVTRLMEQEGIFYFFKHSNGRHVLCLGDQSGAHPDCVEKKVAYHEGSLTEDHVSSWEHQYEFRPGKWAQTDYNFETPGTSLLTDESTVVDVSGAKKYEIYDYPGEYSQKADGAEYTKVRMEEEEVPHHVVNGQSSCRTFSAGAKFTLSRHDGVPAEEGKGYILWRVHLSASDESYVNAENGRQEIYNTFSCIPESVTFRPARITPKPVIQGLQTAVVVGPSGEEIYTDKYGRIKEQFHWDREGTKNEKSSCWTRVSQNWAGKKWGVLFNPRIGQEVVVAFLEGDPDRPLVTGRVYNADQMPPYDLPADQTKSTIKTRSSKDGSPDTFNEIRFEDKKGSEELYFHAEKDQSIVVENDRVELVGNDRSLTVKRDKSEEVDRNKKIAVHAEHAETIDGSMTITVGKNLTEMVGVNYAETVGAAMELTIGGGYAVSVGEVMTETVGGEKTASVGASSSETVAESKDVKIGKDLIEAVDGDHKLEIAKDSKEAVAGTREVTVGKEFTLKADKILLNAKNEIALKAGKAEIVLKKNGDITIKGKKINIKGSGDVIVKGSKIKEN